VTGGTGAYAGLRARGRGLVVANLARGDITVVLEGRRRGGWSPARAACRSRSPGRA